MSAPSILLLCAGAGASLGAVWTSAGLSESSAVRVTPRVSVATLLGLGFAALIYVRAPSDLRSELGLPLLFAAASLLSLGVGAAKLEAALAEKQGDRVVRRAAGMVVGAVLGMAAVGAASLDLSSSSLVHARFGWGFMFAPIASALTVFVGRARYAGAGWLALGGRALMLGLVAAALLAGARLTVAAPAPTPSASTQVPLTPAVMATTAPAASASEVGASVEAVVAPSAGSASAGSASAGSAPAASGMPAAGAIASTSAAPAEASAPDAQPGTVEVGAVTTRGLLEADARGGVEHRKDRLQACASDPKNAQHGSLSFKVGVDASGSVAYAKPLEGDLKGTPLGDCWLRIFYKMGFAAPASNNASFNVTLSAR
jgi:hypothetical protein